MSFFIQHLFVELVPVFGYDNPCSFRAVICNSDVALEKSNDYSGALKVYEQIEQEYPASPEGRDIEKYIERAQLKLKK